MYISYRCSTGTGTSLFTTTGEPPSTHSIIGGDTQAPSVTTLSSLSSLRSLPRSESCASLLSLPSCTSTVEPASGDDTCSLQLEDKPAPNITQKRRASTQMLPINAAFFVTEPGESDKKSRIKVTCNNCYLWRQKCQKEEAKIKELEARLSRAKMFNAELHNKMNAEVTRQILKHKEARRALEQSEHRSQVLMQQNEEQTEKLKAVQSNMDVVKQRNHELEREGKTLRDSLQQTKQQGAKLLTVISGLQQRIVHIEQQMKGKQPDDAATDSKNPWFWVLRMT